MVDYRGLKELSYLLLYRLPYVRSDAFGIIILVRCLGTRKISYRSIVVDSNSLPFRKWKHNGREPIVLKYEFVEKGVCVIGRIPCYVPGINVCISEKAQ